MNENENVNAQIDAPQDRGHEDCEQPAAGAAGQEELRELAAGRITAADHHGLEGQPRKDPTL